MGRLHPKAGHFLDVHLANGHSPTTTATATATYFQPAHSYSSSLTSLVTPLRLAPREESTRIQLQKQRLREQHAKTVLSPSTIPGFKTSAAFFASLRTNLRLHASPPPSPISTPNSMRASAASLPPPSPLSGPADSVMDASDAVTPSEDPLAGVPELSSYLATDEFEKMEGLKLVADSVAQQRQAANQALIFHPLNFSVIVAVLGLMAQYMRNQRYDFMLIVLSCVGSLMCVLAGCRYATQGYLNAAEEINWEWLGDADIFVTKFGDEVIGTIVVEWVSGESRTKKRKAWRGLIRAWTVRLKYRNKGVGGALLEDAVKEAKKKSAESLEFADDHANSKRFLPRLYNGGFDKRERKVTDGLQDLMETSPGRKRK